MNQMNIQHPAACIQMARSHFEFNSLKPIKLRLLPSIFETVKDDISNRIEQFDCLTNNSIKNSGLSGDDETKVKRFQENARREILVSAFDGEFVTKYKEEISYEKTYASLLKFVEEIIGSQTARQKTAEAEKRLNNAVRKMDDEEKFERYLARIERYANDVSSVTEVRNFLIDNTFRKNLAPSIMRFLHEQEKSDKTAREIAKFLDDRYKYKKSVSVNSIELAGATEKINELFKQNAELHQQNSNLFQKMDAMQNDMKMMFMEATQPRTEDSVNFTNNIGDINKLQTAKLKPSYSRAPMARPGRSNEHPSTQQNNSNDRTIKTETAKSYPTHFEMNRYGAPFRCRKCGVLGHRDENCRGTSLICKLCKKEGHISFVCPTKQTQKNY